MKINSKALERVVVGISGGVDSAVSAFLLKKRGYDVVAVFMQNWEEIDEKGYCTGEQDWNDAQIICKKIQIPLHRVNFVKQYWQHVFGNFLQEYEDGFTPNPDIQCNKHIKFDQFFKHAIRVFKADAIATGHYARTSFGPYLENYSPTEKVKLLQAYDSFKDQTFFLCQTPQNALQKAMFPIGTYLKSQVKNLAKEAGLDFIAGKKESTGICFIGKRNFQEFISDYIPQKHGHFIDVDSRNIVGTHNGVHNWTVGQRCRLPGCIKAYFVLSKNVQTNEIFVASGTNHAALFTKVVFTDFPYWIADIPNDILKCKFRFQHTKPLVNCEIKKILNGLVINLDQPLRAITPGQFAVFYKDNECLGCARILHHHSPS